jgi:ParB family chromosome partitioning protein
MEIEMIPIDRIRPSPFQPRETFDKEKIGELADSIKEVDLIQPILVRREGANYQIIAGERRWRAWHDLKQKKIPAIVRKADDIESRELSLIENWHRVDLTSIERENMISALWESGRYKNHEELAKRLGIKAASIKKYLQAKSDREKLGEHALLSTRTILDTGGLEEEERKIVLEKVERGEIPTQKVRDYTKTVKEAPKPVREAILKKGSKITPEVGEKIIREFPEEEQQKEIIKEIERIKDLGEKGMIAHIEERGRIARGERGPELHVSADPNERLVEHCRRVYAEATTITARHALSMPERWKREYIKYMKMMHDHLEKELAELGEIRYLE